MTDGVHIFWILSRATGIGAILMAGLAVTIGLMAGRGLPFAKLRRKLELKPLHEALSIATIGLIVAHGLSLLADPWLHPGPAGVTIPFASGYRPLGTAIGIISAYGLILLGLSYYARKRIGPARWRTIHRFTALFWVLGLVHTFATGSDATELWMVIPVAAVSVPALLLLSYRMFQPLLARPKPAAGSRTASPGSGRPPAAGPQPLRPVTHHRASRTAGLPGRIDSSPIRPGDRLPT